MKAVIINIDYNQYSIALIPSVTSPPPTVTAKRDMWRVAIAIWLEAGVSATPPLPTPHYPLPIPTPLVKLATLDENRKMKTVKKTIRIERGKKEYGLAITDCFVTSPSGSRLGCIQYWRNCPGANSGVSE